MKHRLYGFRRWIFMAVFVVTAGACHSCGRETVSLQPYMAESDLKDTDAGENLPDEAGDGDRAEEAVTEAKKAAGEPEGDPAADSQSRAGMDPAGWEEVCYVHICGAVANPGVYQVAKGQRIYQVVERAGGYTQEAAEDYLNLAAEVADGMKLVVPTREELLMEPGMDLYGIPGTQETAEGKTGKVNLNTAAKEALMGLSGIGEAKAGDIIRYREEHGGFQKIEDIMKVPGIKDSAFQKIKDEVTV